MPEKVMLSTLSVGEIFESESGIAYMRVGMPIYKESDLVIVMMDNHQGLKGTISKVEDCLVRPICMEVIK